MSTCDCNNGMSLREALSLAIALGCTVEWVRRTGEVAVRHPSLTRRVRANGRKKDAPRCLVVMLRHLSQGRAAAGSTSPEGR